MEFTDKSTLEEILAFAGAAEIMQKYDVPCLGCPMARLEMQNLMIGQICAMYGIDLNKLLADLNAAASGKGNAAKAKVKYSKKH